MLPSESYRKFVEMGTLREDHRQAEALVHLDRLYNDLEDYARHPVSRDLTPPTPERRGFKNVDSIKAEVAKAFLKEHGVIQKVHPLSKMTGLYLYGGVGSGKSFLMDIFFAEVPIAKKQRVHFHQFMLDVHKLQHKIRTTSSTGALDGQEIMKETALRICNNAELLCFDELVVADIVDAMILKRLFHAMYSIGICCVFTSNRVPEDLYLNGLNRESFLPFIRMLNDKCIVHNINSDTDYRLTGRKAQTYFAPMNDKTFGNFNKLFLDITSQRIPQEKVLRVFGRDVIAPKTVGAVAYFTFQELCTEDRSAADFGVISKVFHTIFIEGVPRFGPQDSDGRRRFIALIDELYQAKVKVIVLAETELELLSATEDEIAAIAEEAKRQEMLEGKTDAEKLLLTGGSRITQKAVAAAKEEVLFAGKLIDAGEENFQMKRCVSRLQEMRTQEYLESKFAGPGEVTLMEGAPGY